MIIDCFQSLLVLNDQNKISSDSKNQTDGRINGELPVFQIQQLKYQDKDFFFFWHLESLNWNGSPD